MLHTPIFVSSSLSISGLIISSVFFLRFFVYLTRPVRPLSILFLCNGSSCDDRHSPLSLFLFFLARYNRACATSRPGTLTKQTRLLTIIAGPWSHSHRGHARGRLGRHLGTSSRSNSEGEQDGKEDPQRRTAKAKVREHHPASNSGQPKLFAPSRSNLILFFIPCFLFLDFITFASLSEPNFGLRAFSFVLLRKSALLLTLYPRQAAVFWYPLVSSFVPYLRCRSFFLVPTAFFLPLFCASNSTSPTFCRCTLISDLIHNPSDIESSI